MAAKCFERMVGLIVQGSNQQRRHINGFASLRWQSSRKGFGGLRDLNEPLWISGLPTKELLCNRKICNENGWPRPPFAEWQRKLSCMPCEIGSRLERCGIFLFRKKKPNNLSHFIL